MTIVEQYNLTLQIEVVKEQSAEMLARLCKYVGDTYFSKCTDLLLSFSNIVNTELYRGIKIAPTTYGKIGGRD